MSTRSSSARTCQMLKCREFSAWIMSGGEVLPGYSVSVDTNANKISCWIPSEPGKNFSVHWRDEGSRAHSCSFISLDGFLVPGRFLCGIGEASRKGVRTGPNTERPFVFSGRSNTATSGGQINRDAGTIMLKIRRVSMDGARPSNPIQQLPEPSGEQSSVSSHYIGYGEERPTYEQFPQTWNVKPFDKSGNRSYVTFVFRYRPREFLLLQGIMPAKDALQIPPAVRKAHSADRRVVSAPLLATPDPVSSPPVQVKSRRMGPALQNAFNPGSVPVRSVTNVRSVSMIVPSRPRRYPGESTLSFPEYRPYLNCHGRDPSTVSGVVCSEVLSTKGGI